MTEADDLPRDKRDTPPKIDTNGVLHGSGVLVETRSAQFDPAYAMTITTCPTRHAEGSEPGPTARSRKRGRTAE